MTEKNAGRMDQIEERDPSIFIENKTKTVQRIRRLVENKKNNDKPCYQKNLILRQKAV